MRLVRPVHGRSPKVCGLPNLDNMSKDMLIDEAFCYDWSMGNHFEYLDFLTGEKTITQKYIRLSRYVHILYEVHLLEKSKLEWLGKGGQFVSMSFLLCMS
jgi:hypothetical protein